jgi:hypothetical protein
MIGRDGSDSPEDLINPEAGRISVFIAASQLGGRREAGAQTGRNLRPA